MSYETRDMSSLWRSLASSRVTALKDYVNQRDYKAFIDRRILKPGEDGYIRGDARKQSWRQWAGEKINRNTNQNAQDQIFLFPGWATRRDREDRRPSNWIEGSEFSLDVFVSGFASSSRPPDQASRSQRAFLRLAKAFASLPSLPASQSAAVSQLSIPDSYSTHDLRKGSSYPGTPSINGAEELNLEALERQFRQADVDSSETSSDYSASTESNSPTPGLISRQLSPDFLNGQQQTITNVSDLHRLHANFQNRLRPFWSTSLSNRIIRLSLYTTSPLTSTIPEVIPDGYDPSKEPLATQDVLTSGTGAFQANFTIPWDRLCTHPGALQIAFGDPNDELLLHLQAELVPPPLPASLRPETHDVIPLVQSIATVPVTQAPVRVISDIDDTVKLSNVLGGARAVFQNVFVRHLEELCIRGMGEWYTRMWSLGVRFHYVSNMPFELLPVLSEFLKVSQLPEGSIKLKSYAGRSLFNGLLSAPSVRKRDGVLDILRHFPTSQFILVGDTGEQDLELYADLAAERPKQILAIFVREASGGTMEPLEDPTGEKIRRAVEAKRQRSFDLNANRSLFDDPENSPELNLPARPQPVAALSEFATPRRITQTRSTPDPNVTPRANEQPNIRRPAPAVPPKPRMSARSSSMNTDPPQDYFTRRRPPPPPPPRAEKLAVRSPSAPMPATTLSIPSTLFDAELPLHQSPHQSPSSSFISSYSSSGTAMPMTLAVADPSRLLPGLPTPAELQNLSPAEKKRYELQMRVWKARIAVPSHISIRIFREPEECVETEGILHNLQKQHQSSRR